MKHKTSELTGALLDAAAGKAADLIGEVRDWGGKGLMVFQLASGLPFRASTDWSVGGPIIERELIELTNTEKGWYAAVNPWAYYRKSVIVADPPDAEAPTPLIAAMRAFVASKFGDEVELP